MYIYVCMDYAYVKSKSVFFLIVVQGYFGNVEFPLLVGRVQKMMKSVQGKGKGCDV